MKFEVLLESRPATKQVSIDADSYEEAVDKAINMELTETVTLRPTWVDTSEKAKATSELEYEVVGCCDKCGKSIVGRDIPGQPWNYASANEYGGLLCYVCAKGVRA
jgi:hypothetical protein